MEEYSIVRIVRLLPNEDRFIDRSEGIKRQPEVGDSGTIVHINEPGKSYIVECCDEEGQTIWLADFDELELEPLGAMSERIEQVVNNLKRTAEEAGDAFGGLSAEQLNWKPAEKSWSIAQCFDHLITTHSLYFPEFERLAAGTVERSFWQKHSPLSGYFGRFLIKGLDPANQKKMKTTAKAFPSSSEIGGDIIERFCEHQRQMIDHLQKLPADIDPVKTIITSPLFGIVTYSLDDTFTILTVHCQRHCGQAKRVTETAGFPV